MLRNLNAFKHDETYTRLYRIWRIMKQRCLNPKDKEYKYYGSRGITICLEWTKHYTLFRTWAIQNDYKDNLIIDRIDTDGNYEPSISRILNNQRWNNDNISL